MGKMDDTTKSVLIGVGAAVAVGVLTFLFTSDDAKSKTKSVVNRQKAKYYVKDKLNGNSKASKVVEKMTDKEVNALLGTVDKVKDLEDKLSDVTSDFKDFVQDKTKDTKKAVKKATK